MKLEQFCTKLASLDLAQPQQAVSILWFHDEKTPDMVMSAGQLGKIIREAGLGNPNSTILGESVKRTGMVIATSAGYRLKMLARSQIRAWLMPILGDTKPEVDQDLGYLPKAVWANTKDYIENVCVQMNGCYQFGFYDAASVMMRRLVETLIIEAYETLGRAAEIKDGGGNYHMLKELVNRATGANPVGVGRDAKDALSKIKEMGDRSAHNRRYNCVRADMDKVQSGVRVVVDELINIAALRRQPAVAVAVASA
ncbi:MAG: hypothetical protein ACAI43_13035 [Phycisphaerae bacterium]|nr:hypothetical protein [Tepidisphaeraceae bacterium]